MSDALNQLEQNINQVNSDMLAIDDFMSYLLNAQVFMPVADEKSAVVGFQANPKAQPLLVDLNDENGDYTIMPIFSDPEKSKTFLQNFPNYAGGLLVEISWILERIGKNISLSINPNMELGIDLDPASIQQLVTLKHRIANAN